MDRLKFAIIGCGRISYKHIEALVHNEAQAELVAVCDIVAKKAIDKAQEYVQKMEKTSFKTMVPKVYMDYHAMLAEEKIDVISVATESGKHADISLECLAAGKHVIVEKPMALSTKDADAMIACAKQHGVKLCVSHQNRFNATVRKLRQALEAGRFGRIIAGNARVLWNRDKSYYEQAAWRGTYAQDGGCLMNQCIHNIDLLQWMLGGEMVQIQAMLANYFHPYIEAEDYGSIHLRFANGAIGNIEGTVCVFPKNLEETLTVLGENGTVVIGGPALNKILTWEFADGSDSLEQIRQECNNEVDNVYGWGHTPLFADMIDSVRQGREPLVNGAEGKKSMAIILYAYLANALQQQLTFGELQKDITSRQFAKSRICFPYRGQV